MSRGGYRANSGRKPGSVAIKHRVVVADPDKLMPVEWMLAVLRDPETEPQRRDKMAEIAAPYLHPKLSSAATIINGKVEGDTITNNTVNIYAVPRGAALDLAAGTITIEGAPIADLTPIEPFTGTPALTDQRDDKVMPERIPDPIPAPLPIEPLDTSNVTRLNTERIAYRQRKAEEQAARHAARHPPPDDTSNT